MKVTFVVLAHVYGSDINPHHLTSYVVLMGVGHGQWVYVERASGLKYHPVASLLNRLFSTASPGPVCRRWTDHRPDHVQESAELTATN